jgi:hypothetical protein
MRLARYDFIRWGGSRPSDSPNFTRPVSPGGLYHLLHFGVGVNRDDFDVGVVLSKDSENLICERLPNAFDGFEIEKNRLESIDSRKQALCLGTRNQLIVAMVGELYWSRGSVNLIPILCQP